MSGFIGEIPKKITRGWINILDKDNIEMIDTKIEYEDSYNVVDGFSQSSFEILWTGIIDGMSYIAHIGNVYSRIDTSTGDMVVYFEYNLDSIMLEFLEVSELYFKYNDDDEYFVLRDSGTLEFPNKSSIKIGTNSNIYKKVKIPHEVEYIHPHFGTKRKTIKKAWVGNSNNEPKLVLFSDDYYFYKNNNLIPIKKPFQFIENIAFLTYNNKLHIFYTLYKYTESTTATYTTIHYSYNGIIWEEEDDEFITYHINDIPPYHDFKNDGNPFCNNAIFLVYKDKIHLLGCSSYNVNEQTLYSDEHFVYDGSTFKTLTYKAENNLDYEVKLPVSYYDICAAIVYNNKIHLFTNVVDKKHYTYADGDHSWTLNSQYSNVYIGSSIVVYHNKIHSLGGGTKSSTRRKHYSYNGVQWIEESTLPYDFYQGSAIVYNDRIYIFGSGGTYTKCYSWNDTDSVWTEDEELPYNIIINNVQYNNLAAVYNNELHIISNDRKYEHYYKTNDSNKWKYAINNDSRVPFSQLYNPSSIVYNNKIHIINNDIINNRGRHIIYDGLNWESLASDVETGTRYYSRCFMVEYNDKIHIIYNTSKEGLKADFVDHYSYDDINGMFKESSDHLPFVFYDSGLIISYNNKIHIFGTCSMINNVISDVINQHYSYDGNNWTRESSTPYDFTNGAIVVYNDKIHILGGIANQNKHYSYDGSEWVEESILPYSFYNGSAVVYDNKIHILGGEENTKQHYSWNGSDWIKEVDLQQDFYYGSAVTYKNEIYMIGGHSNPDSVLVTNYQKFFQ